MKAKLFFGISILLLVLSTSIAKAQKSPAKPNIVIIFTDDQGYADLGCYGSTTHKTPRLDALADQGMKFTNFYAQTVCGPSRSALLTGRYPSRSLGWSMPASEITWAQLIRNVGYETACIGKWDVSNRQALIPRMPNAKGFNYYFGPLGANDRGKVSFYENNKSAGETDNMGELTHIYTDKAIDFLKHKRDKNKPFALYLSHTMLHTDIDASPKFKGTSAGGLYGDVLEELDYETGRLLDVLEELDLADNTLVIYTTDNGPWNQMAYRKNEKGHPEGAKFWGDAGPLRGGKGSCYEGGLRVPCIIRWPGKVAAGVESSAIFSTIDFLPTFASLCGFQIPEDRIIDGVDQTKLIFGKDKDGARDNFVYMHFSKKNSIENPETPVVYGGNGIRTGKWKYLRPVHFTAGYAKDRSRKKVAELYDLETDPGETTNLADKHPKLVKKMEKKLTKWWKTTSQ